MNRSTRRRGLILILAALVLGALSPATTTAAAASDPAKDTIKVIVTFDGLPGKAATRAIERLGGKVKHPLKLIDGLSADIPRGQLKKLRDDPAVASVEVDGRLTAFDHGPNTGDLEYENAWGVEHIGTREVHLAGNTGQGIKLAIIDTGIDYIHNDPDDTPYVVDPEFAFNYKGGEDFLTYDGDPYDDHGHGTHVAGIIAAEHNGYLVTGVAPGVDLYALKVLGANGEGDYSGLIAALGWAVTNDIDVVNMSLGGHEVSAALQTAIANAYAAGVTLIAASGNVNPGVIQELLYGCPVAYPAAYDQVIAVSFTNTADKLTGFSCTGTQVDLAAPGDQIFSPVPMGPVGSCAFCTPQGYSAQSGTSMAAPHVAGVAALILNAGIADGNADGLLADDVKAHLCATTSPAAGMATTDARYPKWYGCGIVDADKGLIDVPPPAGALAPDAVNDAATTDEDAPTDIAVLANDTNAAGGTLTVTAISDPARGTASLNPDGTIHYVPDADLHGPDPFTYTIVNADARTDTATVSITVSPVNDAPIAIDDLLVTVTDSPSTLDVLANDIDVDGDTLTTTGVGTPLSGTVVVETNGSVTYTPAPGFAGTDAFDYTIADGAGGVATGSVGVSVLTTNSPPIAADDALTTAEDGGATLDVRANDTDPDGGPLTVTAVTAGAHGVVTIESDGSVGYAPVANYAGPDAFDYTVADSTGATDSATVSVTVTAVNDAPTATNDTASTAEDTTVVIDVVANDGDVDGDVLAVTSVGAAAAGTVTVEPDGRIRYTPFANIYGADSFGYAVSDGAGGTASATVSVTISSVNDAPTAAGKSVTTKYGTAVAITLTGADVETCNLVFSVTTGPGQGTLGAVTNVRCITLLPPYADSAKTTYTPTAGFSGTDTFTYRTSDGSLSSPDVTVTVTVQAPTVLHAGDLDGSKTTQSTSWTAKVTIRAHNAAEGSVGSVTVTGMWSNGATGTATCKTSTSGVCTISKASIPKTTTSVTFTVTKMTAAASIYDGAANHDPEADSTGTVIAISGP